MSTVGSQDVGGRGSRGRFSVFDSDVQIAVAVLADGPLLIKGPAAIAADRPDLSFVRYPTPDGDVPFLPGSSLKGVLRSGSEALLRALGTSPEPCEAVGRGSCGERHRNAPERRCPTCYLFGSLHGAGVLQVDDGLPWERDAPPDERSVAGTSVIRNSVAINRQTGAAEGQALFDFEALVDVVFYPTLRLRNPWPSHLGVTATALQMLDDGLLRLGSGSTRGMGRVRVQARGVTVTHLRGRTPEVLGDGDGFERRDDGGVLVREVASDPAATLATWRERLPAWLEG